MPLPLLFAQRAQNILPSGCDVEACFGPRQRMAFRANLLKTTPEEVCAWLKAQGMVFEPVPWYKPAFTVTASDSQILLASTAATEGRIYAQGLESILAVAVLDPKPGEAVLDMCAAPGSKTSQIAAHMNNEGSLTANEPVRARFYRLKSVLDLTGAQARLVMKDGRYLRQEAGFDRVLVDAPCSSEGRFCTDDPKSYAYWSLRKIHEMAHKQKGILLNAGRLVKPGGTLVYATCTLAPEENEEVIRWFLRKTEGQFALEPIIAPGLATYPASIDQCLRILPGPSTGGFFLARLKRL